MGRRLRICGGCAAVLLAVLATSCVPVKNSRFPKIGYDNSASSFNPNERDIRASTVAGLRLAWRRDLHLSAYNSLTAGRQFVYAVDGSGDLVALDRRTGAVAWKAVTDTTRGWFYDAPTISGGRAYIGSMAEGRLYAFNGVTGRKLWSVEIDDVHAQTIPTVAHGLVYAFGDGELHAFDAVTGARRLRIPSNHDVSPRVIGDELHLTDEAGTTVVYDARTGARLREGGLYRSGAVAGRRLFLVARDQVGHGSVGSTGLLGITVLWGMPREDLSRGPAVGAGRFFFGTRERYEERGEIVALSADTGTLLWRARVEGGASSPPVIAGNVVYIGSWSNRLYAFATRGCGQEVCRPLWSVATAEVDDPTGLRNGVVVVDGTLFVPAASGEVLAYRLP